MSETIGGERGALAPCSSPQPSPPAPEQRANAPRSPKSKRLRLALAVLVLALLVFGVWYFAIRATDDRSRLQGDWQLAVPAFDRDGNPAARAVRGVTVRFTGAICVWRVGDQEQKRYAVELRPEAKEIDLTQLRSDGTPLIQRWPPPERPVMLRGIYSIDGSQVRIVVGNGDEERPADIEATDGVTVWVLERK